jgi:UDP-2,3-diacylglucosamine hydrolase
MSKPALIVSDLHLGAVPDAVRDRFIRFLRHWHGRADTLLINGDLFDFWFEYRTVIQSQHFQTLRALAELRDSGVKLVLVGGNHDAWGGPFLEDELGMRLEDGPFEMELGGRRAFIAHGDGIGPGDHGYKALKRTLRCGPVCYMMRLIHPDLADRIVGRITRTGVRDEVQFKKSRERGQVLEKFAADLLESRDDLDLVIFGHCHQPQVTAIGTHGYYVNSGDWVEHSTFTVVTEEEIRQEEWEG